MQFVLEMLRHNFGEQRLFGEVLGPDNEFTTLSTARRQQDNQTEYAPIAPCGHCRAGRRRRSSRPNIKSASSASAAAGIAPAKINWVFHIAKPRQMNSTQPPATT